MFFCFNHHVLWKEDRKMALSNQETQNKGPESTADPFAKDPNSNQATNASPMGKLSLLAKSLDTSARVESSSTPGF